MQKFVNDVKELLDSLSILLLNRPLFNLIVQMRQSLKYFIIYHASPITNLQAKHKYLSQRVKLQCREALLNLIQVNLYHHWYSLLQKCLFSISSFSIHWLLRHFLSSKGKLHNNISWTNRVWHSISYCVHQQLFLSM